MQNRHLARAVLALSLAGAVPGWSAPLFERSAGSLSPALTDEARTASVVLNRETLRTARAGSEIEVRLPEVGDFRFRIVQRVEDGDVVRLDGVLVSDANYRLTLGVRAAGVSGLIATPQGSFSLGYVNQRQWVGVVGKAWDWAATDEVGRPVVFEARRAAADEQPPVKGADPIELNLVALTDMEPGDEASLRLADIGPVRVSYEETQANQDSTTWVGYLTDYGKDFRVLLTYSPAGVQGHIVTPQGDYMIQPGSRGGTYLVDPRKLGMRHVEGEDFCPPPPAAAVNGRTDNATATTGTSSTTATSTALPGSTVIDVLVLYTPGFATDKGGSSGVNLAIDNLIAVSNQAYKDSGVAIQLRRVGAEQVNVSDKTSNSTVLNDLTNGTGAFSTVKSRRNALGADLVTLVRPFWVQSQGSCGVGWIGGYNLAPVSNYANYAYSVVSEGNDRAKSGYYCHVTSFVHELGHNMGLMHDRANAGSAKGATSYAYGYGMSGTFGTVMSYLWPKLIKFSNPNDYTCGGSQRCGVPDTDAKKSADNAKTLGATRTAVSGFRSTSATPASLLISGVVTVNGRIRSGVTINGASCTKTNGSGVYQCTVSAGFSGTLKPSYVLNGKATTFTPASRSYSNLSVSATNQRFAGTR